MGGFGQAMPWGRPIGSALGRPSGLARAPEVSLVGLAREVSLVGSVLASVVASEVARLGKPSVEAVV